MTKTDKDPKTPADQDNPLNAARWIGALVILGLAIFTMIQAIGGVGDAPLWLGIVR